MDMLRKFIFLGLLVAAGSPVVGQNYNADRIDRPNTKKINIGIKAGFNSSMFMVSELKIKDVTIDEVQNNYKIGYFGALFMRINMKKHFIQPEVSYNVSKGEITFDKLGSQHPAIEPDYASVQSVLHSVDFPVLYGYNVVKKGPYGRCVFHCDNTVVDHQSVDIKFENQVTASFLMTAFTDQCARRIRLMGTKGEIKGDMDAGTIEIRDFVSGNLETIELHTPANGHNGSDMSMMHDFVRMVGEGRKGKTDAAVSVESHLMALAAEEARITGQVVNLRGFANENK